MKRIQVDFESIRNKNININQYIKLKEYIHVESDSLVLHTFYMYINIHKHHTFNTNGYNNTYLTINTCNI